MSILNKISVLLACLTAWFTFLPQIQAQQDFQATDGLTLHLYYEKNWDSLIIAGKQAIKNGKNLVVNLILPVFVFKIS